jgi:hypothetical protein
VGRVLTGVTKEEGPGVTKAGAPVVPETPPVADEVEGVVAAAGLLAGVAGATMSPASLSLCRS